MTGGEPALLELHDLVVSFGGLRAVDGVSLRVAPGALTGLIGPNGAGKSTIIDAVTGFVPVGQGSIAFDGEVVTRVAAHRRARRGLVRTFQSLELFDDLTVAENVSVPTTTGHWWRNLLGVLSPRRRPDDGRVDAVLEQLRLRPLASEVPGVLSQADRRNVVLARVLVGEPKLVLLDEPAAGLDATGAAALGARLRGLVDEGLAILLVDHDMSLVLNVCDYVFVIDAGRLIAQGTPAEVRRDPEVLRSYLGEEPPAGVASLPSGPSPGEQPMGERVTELLALDRVTAGYGRLAVVRDLDLHVDEGEIVTMLGPNGAGKTTTLLTSCGFLPALDGEVRVCGEPLSGGHPSEAARRGVVLVPEDRACSST